MKKALCIQNLENFSDLINKKQETIELALVDREVCEKPENLFLQLIPYVSFYTVNEETGLMEFIRYVRSNAGSEERLHKMVSIGFGGHIDDEELICSLPANKYQNEDGTWYLDYTYDNILKVIDATARQELKEELGFDVFEKIGFELTADKVVFAKSNDGDDVSKVHLAASISVKLSQEQFTTVLEACSNMLSLGTESKEVTELGRFAVYLSEFIETMDITATMNRIKAKISQSDLRVESWTWLVVDYILRQEIQELIGLIKYTNLVQLNKAIAQAIEAKRLEEEAQAQAQQEEVKVVEGELV